jgi:hypothetical protein
MFVGLHGQGAPSLIGHLVPAVMSLGSLALGGTSRKGGDIVIRVLFSPQLENNITVDQLAIMSWI